MFLNVEHSHVAYIATIFLGPIPGKPTRRFAEVGPDYTQELLEAVGIQRPPWPGYPRVGELLDHYVGQHQDGWALAADIGWR